MDRLTSVWYYTPSAPIAFSFPGSAPQPELTSTSAVVFFFPFAGESLANLIIAMLTSLA
jgi:hypothetical protein